MATRKKSTARRKPAPRHICGDCGASYSDGQLDEIDDFFQRVEAGDMIPSGQCPKPRCGALCYPKGATIVRPNYNGLHRCDNCGENWNEDQLDEIDDYFQRVDEGGMAPSGQCPSSDCGSLCYPL